VASCCAEVVQKLTLFPLDTVKTRLQCSRREGPSARPSSPLQEMAQVLAALVREPGWVASLYRGVVPAVLGCIPTALVQSSGPLSRLPSFDSFQQRPCAAAGVHAHLRALSTPLPTPWHSVGCGGGHWSCQRQREGAYPGYQSQTTAPALPRVGARHHSIASGSAIPCFCVPHSLQLRVLRSFLTACRALRAEGGLACLFTGLQATMLLEVLYAVVRFCLPSPRAMPGICPHLTRMIFTRSSLQCWKM